MQGDLTDNHDQQNPHDTAGVREHAECLIAEPQVAADRDRRHQQDGFNRDQSE
jgi:hypothetical protein